VGEWELDLKQSQKKNRQGASWGDFEEGGRDLIKRSKKRRILKRTRKTSLKWVGRKRGRKKNLVENGLSVFITKGGKTAPCLLKKAMSRGEVKRNWEIGGLKKGGTLFRKHSDEYKGGGQIDVLGNKPA